MTGRREDNRPLRFAHHVMACTFEVYVFGHAGDYAAQAAAAAFAEADRLERVLSRFLETSDVARINGLAAGESAIVGVETVECLRLAVRVREETGGAFDVTFGSATPAARCVTSLRDLDLDVGNRRVTARAAGTRVDLGGIGKGYALDQMLSVLRDWGIEHALLHAGASTTIGLGGPARGDAASTSAGWHIELRDPDDPSRSLARVALVGGALSGAGRRLHGEHVVDPRTGAPPPADASAAWALAPTAAESDALATAFLVMTAEEVGAHCRTRPCVGAARVELAAGGPSPRLRTWGALANAAGPR